MLCCWAVSWPAGGVHCWSFVPFVDRQNLETLLQRATDRNNDQSCIGHTGHPPVTFRVTDSHSASPFIRRCICTSDTQTANHPPLRECAQNTVLGHAALGHGLLATDKPCCLSTEASAQAARCWHCCHLDLLATDKPCCLSTEASARPGWHCCHLDVLTTDSPCCLMQQTREASVQAAAVPAAAKCVAAAGSHPSGVLAAVRGVAVKGVGS